MMGLRMFFIQSNGFILNGATRIRPIPSSAMKAFRRERRKRGDDRRINAGIMPEIREGGQEMITYAPEAEAAYIYVLPSSASGTIKSTEELPVNECIVAGK